MGLTGDFDKLDRLRASLRELQTNGFLQEISAELGRTSVKLVADGFRDSRDPYGTAWKNPVLRDGQPLRDTGRMAASVNFNVTGGGFRLSIPVAYAPVHQEGATIRPKNGKYLKFKTRAGGFYSLKQVVIPQRMMVPTRDGGLGDIWLDAFNASASAMITRKLQAVA